MNNAWTEHLRSRLAGMREVRVWFFGAPPRRREIEKLIALLELAKDAYPEEDALIAELDKPKDTP